MPNSPSELLVSAKHKVKNLFLQTVKFLIDLKYLRNHTNLISALTEKLLKVRVVDIEWLDNFSDCEKILLRPKADGFAYGPCSHSLSTEKEIILPDIYAYYLSDVTVHRYSSSFVKNSRIVIERISTIQGNIINFNEGYIVYNGKFKAILRCAAPCVIDKGIFLAGNGSFNYYHWLMEIIPKLEFIDKFPASYPLLVSEDVLKQKSFKEIIRIFAPGRELLYLKNDQYSVRDMVYITAPNHLPFNLFPNYKFKIEYFLISFSSLKFIRNTVLKHIYNQSGNKASRIFLKRDNTRRSYNQDEIERVLLTRGFTSIRCEELSFCEQVAVFNAARYIVGPTGAAWSNLLFSNSGARGLCWMAEEYGDFSVFSTLAKFSGVDLRYMYYKAGSRSTKQLYKKNYSLNIHAFENTLSSLLNDQ